MAGTGPQATGGGSSVWTSWSLAPPCSDPASEVASEFKESRPAPAGGEPRSGAGPCRREGRAGVACGLPLVAGPRVGLAPRWSLGTVNGGALPTLPSQPEIPMNSPSEPPDPGLTALLSPRRWWERCQGSVEPETPQHCYPKWEEREPPPSTSNAAVVCLAYPDGDSPVLWVQDAVAGSFIGALGPGEKAP